MRSFAFVCGLTLLAAVSAAAAPSKLPQFGFEDGAAGWTSLSAAGKVLIAATPKRVRTGQLALEYRYKASKEEPPFLGCPLPGAEGMSSLALDVSSDSPTILVVALVEEGGVRYEYLSATTGEAWQHLEIDRSEFVRSEDTPDADGRLDLDQVRCLVIADLRALLSGTGDDLGKLLGERAGEHAFWLDNVAFQAQAALPNPQPGELVLEDCRRENLCWLPLAGVAPGVGAAPGGSGRALALEYSTEEGKLAAILRRLAPGALARVHSLSFETAARSDTALAVALEEIGGARYVATLSVQGGGRWQRFVVRNADLKLAEGTQDANGRLDMDAVKSLAFIDLSGLRGRPPAGRNKLWLRDLKGVWETR